MAKRKLTEQERELTKKGVKTREKNIKEKTEALAYLVDFDKFNKKWEGYIEEKRVIEVGTKKKILEQTRKSLVEEIQFETETVKTLQSHLTEGVEVKKMVGVT